ncbi:MAG: M14 family zinc carboxypeptidase [Pseudomonadota bacterium]
MVPRVAGASGPIRRRAWFASLIRWCLLAALLPVGAPPAAETAIGPTPLVRNGYRRMSSSAEISADLAALAAASPLARVERLGLSVQGRPLEALVLQAPAAVDPLRVLVVGSQHGASEPAGAEAFLALARELIWGDLRPLLDSQRVILIPNANPDGRELGRRSNANGVNINTDFVRARAPETRALLHALARYEPEAVLDSHESAVLKRKSLGREGWLTDFEIQYEIANHPGVPAPTRALSAGALLPALLAAATAAGHAANRYIGEITSTAQPITNGGFSLRNFRNTAGVQNRISFLVETRLDSGERDYPTWRNIAVREARQLHCLRSFLATIEQRRAAIRAATAAPVAGPLPLHASYQADPGHPWAEIGLRRRDSGELVLHRFADHRRVVLGEVVEPPAAYLITAGQELLRPLLRAQAIAHTALDRPRTFAALSPRLAPTAPGTALRLAEWRPATLEAPAGALLIELDQRRGRQAVLLLDPRSSSSLFQYPEFAALFGAGRPPPLHALPRPPAAMP